ncbi:TPA: hypothetical protein EYP44_03920, partial [Candidatus Bathyarchaeota archaeon]|nr:hypothetical protein [Candidatus Bathyarchaeota archaeon]
GNGFADIQMADLLRDRLGLDTISTGNIIGFAMECFEKGLITARETAGPDLRFGNGEAMVRMVERIARRDTPIGGVLAEGHTRATQAIGKGPSASYSPPSASTTWSVASTYGRGSGAGTTRCRSVC